MPARIFTGVVLFLLIVSAQAQSNAYLDALIQQSRTMKLAEHQEWLKLGHYQSNIFTGYSSEIISKAFFNAENGMQDPQAELEATLASFFSDKKETDKQQNPQCQFIARYRWLDKHLKFDNKRLPKKICKRFNDWYKSIDPEQATLIFPAGTDDSPASMFGHTLFRFDKKGQTEKTRLFSYSINFAAETNESNGLIFAFKGIFGGYPGRFSIIPYYEKVTQYNDMEHRDIWEYQLNLSKLEIRRLLEHAWEIAQNDFAYYFFLENCSYQLLSLLDVARPGHDLTGQFSVWAIPGDTVAVVLEDKKILKKAVFRPSVRSKIRHQLSYLSSDEKDIVLDLVHGQIKPDDKQVESLPDKKRALTIITAYDYLQYMFNRGAVKREVVGSRSISLLRARNKISVKQTIPPMPTPAVRFEQGHGTSRFAIGGGKIKTDNVEQNYAEIKFRPAYHSLLDFQDGYTRGAQINFGDITVRYNEETEKYRLHEFMLIDIFSMPGRDRFFKPLTWKVNTGFVRRPIDDHVEERLVYSLNGGFGLSYALTDDMSVFTMLDLTFLFHDKLKEKIAAAAGPSLGMSWRVARNWNTWLSASVQYFDESLDLNWVDYRFENNFALSTNTALRISAIERGDSKNTQRELSAALHWYFR